MSSIHELYGERTVSAFSAERVKHAFKRRAIIQDAAKATREKWQFLRNGLIFHYEILAGCVR